MSALAAALLLLLPACDPAPAIDPAPNAALPPAASAAEPPVALEVAVVGGLAPARDTVKAPPPPADEPARSPLAGVLSEVLEQPDAFQSVPFPLLVEKATGNQVLPIDPDHPADQAMLDAVGAALDLILPGLSRDDSPVREMARINEVSRLFEDELQQHLDALDDFSCTSPLTDDGRALRSGYPDLRLEHLPSGRVTYIDPKVHAATARASTFRTFYYEPKTDTNKITESARHLLIGIEHDGNAGAWQVPAWSMVDLSGFEVRLKLEFQASNADLYRDELIIRRSADQ